MGVYLCRWPNGDVSFVSARSRAGARRQLDRLADPSDCRLIRVKNFQVDFRLADDGMLEMEGFTGDEVFDALAEAYPSLDKLSSDLKNADLCYPLTSQAEVPDLTAEENAQVYLAVLTERHRYAQAPLAPGTCVQCATAAGTGDPPICDQCMEALSRQVDCHADYEAGSDDVPF